jgi:hypothetical protein
MNLSRYRYFFVNFLTAFFIALLVSFSFAKAQSSTPLTNFPTFNGAVSTIAVSGTTIYVGGGFTQATDAPANGGATVTRNRLAAIDMTTGALFPWNPNADNNVGVVTVNGSIVYVGGGFSNVGGQPRLKIAALDAGTGLATAWNPGSASISSVNAIAVSGTTVYTGGLFTNIGGQPRSNIAAIDAATGLATAWNPNANADITTLLVNGTTVYTGGAFTNIGGQTRNRIAALDATINTNNATAWDPNANGFPSAMALNGTTLYVGGAFTNIGGFARNRIAALNTLVNTNNATAWNPSATGDVSGIAISGTIVYVCGAFANTGGQLRNRIAALDATVNTLNATVWNPDADAGANAIAVSGSNVFVGGAFSTIGGSSRQGFATFGPPTSPLVVPASLSPLRHANNAAAAANIVLPFDQTMLPASLSATQIKVHSNLRQGLRTTAVVPMAMQATVNPAINFLPNEVITVSVTGANSTVPLPNRPFVYQFRAAASGGAGNFYRTDILQKIDNNTFSSHAVGDFDNDGRLDIVATNNGGLSVSLQTVPNVFAPYATIPYGFGATTARMIKIADVNNDNNLDILVLHASTQQLVVWLGNGTGGFGAATTYTVTGAGDAGTLSVADVDSDGDVDVVSGDYVGGSLHVMLNNGSGVFSVAPGSPFAVGVSNCFSTDVADVDGDGDIDVVGTRNGTEVWVMLNNGLGRFYGRTGSPYTIGSANNGQVLLGDVDNDGDVDMIISRRSPDNSIDVRLNDGTGNFTASAVGSPYAMGTNLTAGGYAGNALADIDGDGNLDILVATNGGLRVLRNSGGTFALTALSPFPTAMGAVASVMASDIDGDGDIDATILTETPAAVIVIKNGVQPVLTTLAPARNINTAAVGAAISPTFNQTMTTATASVGAFKAWGGFTGLKAGAYSGGGTATPVLTPSVPFSSGEQVWVTVTNAQTSLAGSVGIAARPQVYGFRTAVSPTSPGTFPAQMIGSPFAAGATAYFVAQADFDGINGLDMVVVNRGANNVSVFLNTGAGTYGGLSTLAAGTTPECVSVGDVDGVNGPDIIIGNNGSANVTVWLNNGSGGFTGGASYGAGGNVNSVAVVDLDGDGDLDLATANIAGANQVGVLFNNGSGVFSGLTNYAIGTGPRSVTAGDFDSDGDLDLAFTPSGAGINNVGIMMNTGLGTFTSVVNYPVGANPSFVVSGAIDANNSLDLAVGYLGGTSVSTLMNSGTGTFGAANNYTVGTTPQGVALGDIDGDGDLDLVTANSGTNNASVLLNDGSGGMGVAVNYAVGVNPRMPVLGDVDGDGDLDMAVINQTPNNVSVLRNTPTINVQNNGPLTFTTPPTTPTFNTMTAALGTNVVIPFTQTLNAGTVNAANFRVHGGFTGLKTATYGAAGATATVTPTQPFKRGEQVFVTVTNATSSGGAATRPFVMGFRTAAGVGPGTFYPATNSPYAAGTQPWFSALGDVDGDGDLDMASSFVGGTGGFYIRLNNGSGDFTTQAVGSPFTITNAQGLAFGDVDNDGDLDLVIVAAGSVHVRLNNGSGGFATVAPGSPIAVGAGARNVVFGDVNGDGVLDIAVPCQTAGQVYILWGAGTGAFGGGALYAHANAICAALGDIDNDGDLDLVSGDVGFYNVNVRLNTGGGLFSAATTYSMTNSVSGVALADVNGDGYLDLGATCQFPTPQLVVRINDGSGGFATSAPGSPYSATGSLYSMNFADVDGDNDLDAVMANYVSGSDVAVRLNNGSGNFSATAAGSPFSAGLPGIGAARFATVGDVDGDGDLDVVTANDNGNSVSVLANTLAMNVAGNLPPFTPRPATTPLMNTMNVASGTNITIPFSANLNAPTVNATNFRVHGTMRGLRTATYGVAPANTATLTGITSSFLPNEQVWVSVTNAQSTGGASTRPFVMGFRTAAGAGPGTFYQVAAFPTGVWPYASATGDVDGDGDLDMVIANRTGASATVLLNNGANVFSPSAGSPFSVGTNPQGITLGDVDGDGDLDIVTANTGSNNITVLLNNGSGVYAPAVGSPFGAGTQPVQAELGDVDGDGDLDMVIANGGSANMTVRLNNGAGNFATAAVGSPFALAGTPNGVALGDVDGDGDIDAAVTNYGGNTIFVRLNDGLGGFGTSAAGSPFATGTQPCRAAIGDVDGDGDLDLAIPNQATNNVTLLLNNGSGGYAAAVGSPFAVGTAPQVVSFGDVDGDGDLDLATANLNSNDITIRLNNGTGGFATQAAGSPFPAGIGPRYVSFGDIDGDGDVDLIVPNDGTNTVSVLKNGTQPLVSSVTPPRNGNGSVNPNIAGVGASVSVNFSTNITGATFTVPPAQQLFQVHGGYTGSRTLAQGFAPNGTYSGGAANTTFTPSATFRPGELVSVTVTNASSSVAAPNNSVGIRTRPFVFDYRVAAGAGPGNFSVAASGSPFGAGALARSAALGDVDGDGDLDIATANQTGTNVTVLANNGSGSYTGVAGSPFAVGGAVRSLVFGDVDNDGDLDLVITRFGSNTVVVLLNNGSGSFTTSAPGSPFAVGTGPYTVALGDVDGDGDLDLATANNGTNNVTLLLNNGVGTFTPAIGSPIAVGTGASGVDFGDVDGDGDLDLAVANNGSNDVTVLLNNGTGLYTPIISSPFAVSTAPRSVTFGDLDGDGDIDFATSNQGSNNVTVLLNNGVGSFSPSPGSPFAAGTQPISLSFGDVDGDGDLDLATANQGSNNVTVLLNNGAGTFAPTANSPFTAGTQPNSVAFGDVDGDGDLDLAAANGSSNNVSVLLNQPPSTTFYYRSGDAGNPANWFNTPNPTGGTPASSFSSPATDFYVMGGGTTTTATVSTAFTLGANVSLHVTTPSVLAVANGITITNNGFLNVSGSTLQAGTLRLVGTGAVVGNTVKYWSTNATLEYQPIAPRLTTNVEFPPAMYGSVLISGSQVIMQGNKTITGTTTIQPTGAFSTNAGFVPTFDGSLVNAGGSMDIGGSASVIFNSRVVGPWIINAPFNAPVNLTLNLVPGATLTLGAPLNVSNTLTLTQGYIQTTPTNLLSVTNTAPGAITPGSANAHITGPLRRTITAAANSYSYPVGGGTPATYLPSTLSYASAAGGTTVAIEAITTPSGGTAGALMAGGSLSTTEYWRVNPSAAVNNAQLVFDRTIPTLTTGAGGSILGTSTTPGGIYNGFISAVTPPSISNVTVFTPLAAGNSYFAIGSSVGPPIVTALSPTRNNSSAPVVSPIQVTFSQSLSTLGMRSWGSQTGLLAASTFAGNTGTISPAANFKAGEKIMTTVIGPITTNLVATPMTAPHVYEFRARANGGTGNFIDSRRYPTPTATGALNVVMGQFDNSPGLDMAVSAGNTVRIYRNDGTGTFSTPALPDVDVVVGNAAFGMGTGDFDNDGDVDIMVNCQGTNEVWMIRNNNNGTYTPQLKVSAAPGYLRLVVADFDGDGDLDFANVLNVAGAVYLYLNDGAANFSPGAVIVISNLVGLDAADLDNDGDIDIIMGRNLTGQVLYALNNGNGTFAAPVLIGGTASTYNLQTGDVNADGFADIINTDNVGNQIFLRIRTGALTYTLTTLTLPGSGNFITRLDDIDGDGDLDITAINTDQTSLNYANMYVLKNDGAGNFTIFSSNKLVGSTSSDLGTFAAGDLDGDGDIDIAIPKSFDNQLAVVFNQSPELKVTSNVPAINAASAVEPITITPTFNIAVTGATATLGGSQIRVLGAMSASRNIVGGGGWAGLTFTPNNIPTLTRKFFPGEKVDIIVTTTATTVPNSLIPMTTGTVRQFTVRAGVGPGTFVQTATPVVGATPYFSMLGDVDGDGDLDLAVANQGANTVSVHLNTAGVYGAGVPYAVDVSPQLATLGDVNNDGLLDIVTANGIGSVSVLLNLGAGIFGAAATVPFGGGITPVWVALADVDGDGDLDMATANYNSNNVYILLNSGTGTFAVSSTIPVGTNSGSLAFGDMDNDGDIDIAVTNYGAASVSILTNSGTGAFTVSSTVGVGTSPVAAIGDLDGDGDLDLAVANNGSNSVSILTNPGTGTFAVASTVAIGTSPWAVNIGDVDGDGDLDVVTANRASNNVTVLLNNGSATFTPSAGSPYTAGTQPRSVPLGDIDGDGDLDLAVTNEGSNTVSIMSNQNSPTRAGFGNAIAFNGSTQTVNTSTSVPGTSLTLEALVNPGAGIGQIAGKNNVVGLALNAARQLTFQVGDGTVWTGPVMTSTSALPLGAWSHVAASYDGSVMRIFINGVLDSSTPVVVVVANNAAPFSIGTLSGGAPFFSGQIDEVRLWNAPLLQTTINTYKGLEIGTTHPNWSNLLGYWRFNEYGGTTAADASGNGNTGTLVNAPTSTISLAPVSMIADPAFAVPTTVSLPATVAVGLPTITQVALPAPTFGSITPAIGNPVNYTPFIAIPSGAVDNFTCQATDGTTTSQATVSVRYRPQLTGNSFAVAGLPTLLTAPTINGGTPPFTWNWSPTTDLVPAPTPATQFPTFFGTASRSYTVSVTDVFGFSASAPVSVTVVPGAFYYTSGDAAVSSQWLSAYGTGTPAPSLSIPGTTFIVMGSTVFGSTTATTVNNMVIGTGVTVRVQAPSVLTIADGTTLTNFGTLIVEGNSTTGGTLRLLGTGTIVGNAPLYAGSQSVLQYSGTNVQRSSSPIEFPGVMGATVVVDENVTVVLDGNKTLASALVLGGLVDIRGRNVILQGRLDLRGAFISDGLSDLEIGTGGGTPSGITGALKIATNVVRNFTLNRPGSSVLLGSPLLVQSGLSMARGILRSDTTNYPIIVNTSFSAVAGGNDSSYVEGPLERYFPTNLAGGSVNGWLFPVGRGARYLPFRLLDPRTGGDAPLLRVEALTGALGGTVDGTLRSAGQGEYWNVRLRAGDHTQSRAELGRFGAFAQAIPSGSVVAKSPTQTGTYTNVGGSIAGNLIQSGTFSSFSTFTIGTPFSTTPVSQQPVITGFGPATGTSGTTVLLDGTNLGGLSSVLFGGVPVSFTVISSTQISLSLVNGAQSGPITLTTTTNGSATSFQPFTYIGSPTMATVSPQYFAVGQDIIINGDNFYGTPTLGELYLPVVRIGGITASNVEILSPTQMRVRFPVATTGNLTVQSWGGVATTASVVGVLPAPRILSFQPGTAAAGETVTLTGTDFRLIGSVSIGGIPIPNYVVNSSTSITLTLPPGSTSGTIRLQGAGGSTTSTTGLTIIPPPVITSFTPGGGSAGQVVTITGRDFTGATVVRFGNTTATFTVSADGRTIEAIIPGGVVTGATISVTTRGGTGSSATGFLGKPAPDPVITGFAPVPVTEGSLLTVLGVNFPYNPNTTTANVILGGVAVPGAYYTSSTTLVLRVPSGVVPFTMLSTQAIVTLQTPRGSTSASLQVPILAPDAPVITGFTPEEGDSVTTITIEGRNFGTSLRTSILDITIGGVPVESFVILNSRVIVSVAGVVTSGAIVIRTPVGTVTTTGTFRYTGTPVGGVSAQDSLALLRLYTDLGGPGWTNNTNWGRGFVGSWYGVTVENSRVTELRLGTNNVRGTLSAPAVDSALARMSGLRVLDLSNNGLAGALPRSIGKLALLETLNLSKNKLTGNLKDLCGLVRLRDMDVSNNGLRDSLSGVLCCLTSLERANVSNNRIYGAVPLCLLDLERLSLLDASANELTDSLPSELGGMRSLAVLNLRRNRLTGSLPGAWGNVQANGKTTVSKGAAVTSLVGLQTLDLGANALTGSIPASWSSLTGLRVLALDSNRLTGAVPAGFVQLLRLQTLSLGRNSLSDAPDLRGIARLTTLGLADNAFEFGPLEVNRPSVSRSLQSFGYAPQAEVGQSKTETVALDAPARLTLRVSGENNRYEWRKRQSDGSWLPVSASLTSSTGASTSGEWTVAAFQVSDAGVYRCYVTNPLLPLLTLVSREQTLRGVAPVNVPPMPRLVEPENGETTALRPVLVWTVSAGAASYVVQIATTADFRVPLSAAWSVPQTLEALQSGVVEAVAATKLERSTRYYWRVLARNSFGESEWATTATFTTADKNIAFTARIVEFGRVPRLDTGMAVIRVRNVADGAATLVSAVAEQSGMSGAGAPIFSIDASASVVGGVRFGVGEVREYAVQFVPSAVRRYDVGVAFAYSMNGQRDIWTQANRLRGVGSALKLVAPAFDTILIGLPRVSAALLINRGDVAAEVRQARIVGGRGNFSIKGESAFALGAGDTTTVVLRCEAGAPGAIPSARLEAAGVLTNASESIADTAVLVLRSYARYRQAGDVVARLGARPVQQANNVPPGTTVPIEVYLNTEVSTSLDSLRKQTLPSLSGSLRYGNQVLTLSAQEQSWRRVRNTSAKNRSERVLMPQTALSPNSGSVLAQFRVQVVAGETDTTTIEIEDIRWLGVYLIEYEIGGVRSRVSEAGGKRLIGGVGVNAPPTIVAIAPNPARDEVEVRYTLPTEGEVRLVVLDARGMEVMALVGDERQQAGEYSIRRAVTGLPSGNYTLRLTLGGRSVSHNLTIVR